MLKIKVWKKQVGAPSLVSDNHWIYFSLLLIKIKLKSSFRMHLACFRWGVPEKRWSVFCLWWSYYYIPSPCSSGHRVVACFHGEEKIDFCYFCLSFCTANSENQWHMEKLPVSGKWREVVKQLINHEICESILRNYRPFELIILICQYLKQIWYCKEGQIEKEGENNKPWVVVIKQLTIVLKNKL